ncbi:MAG: metal-dependent transcriptional regulator [Phototrophicaceae bacterium]
MDDLSVKMRAYLAEVYRLVDREQPDDGFVSTSALADMLMVSPPAVNRMVNRLKELDLLEHEPYQGILLTDAGKREALQYLRAHRIAEVFLSKVMGFDWDQIYTEATKISPALTDPLINRMAAMSGNPQFCPHGEPIPQSDGSIEVLSDILLSDAEAGRTVKVTRMRTREADRLTYIEALGLLPERDLQVIHKAPFNGPMQLKIDDEYRIIGHNLAELIRVVEISEEAS